MWAGAAAALWVGKALQGEDRFELYEALQKVPTPEPWLSLLLASPRMFVRKPTSVPSLGRLNGVGFGMAGGTEFAPDGTYVKTHF